MLALFCLLSAFTAADADTPDVRVMSYNIRYGTAKDGENVWPNRREFLAETVREFDPDLLGTQETLKDQKDFLAEKLPHMTAFGVGREDGTDRGEMTALYFRTDRFEKLDGGHFSLSEQPDTIGVKSWDSSLPRMATWVILRDRNTGQEFLFANTHFDHRGEQARLESSRLMTRRLPELTGGRPIVLTGDFNAGEGSQPYKALFEGKTHDAVVFRDAYRLANPQRGDNEGTYTGFKSNSTAGARIDWIAVSPSVQVVSSTIDRTSRDGRTPSDHAAVTAVVRVGDAPAE